MKQTMIAACVLTTLATLAPTAQADRYDSPRRPDERGTTRRIWAQSGDEAWDNSMAYCMEREASYKTSHINEHPWALSWYFECGLPNTDYVTYDWDEEDWFKRRSGSAAQYPCSTSGRGHAILRQIRCGYWMPLYDNVAIVATEDAAFGYCREAGYTGVNDYIAKRKCSGKVKAYDPFWNWWYDVNATSSSCQLYITELECDR